MKLLALAVFVLIQCQYELAQGAEHGRQPNEDTCNVKGGECVPIHLCKKTLINNSCSEGRVCCRTKHPVGRQGKSTDPIKSDKKKNNVNNNNGKSKKKPVASGSGSRQDATARYFLETQECLDRGGHCKKVCLPTEIIIKKGCIEKAYKCCAPKPCASETGKCVPRRKDCPGTIKKGKKCFKAGKKYFCCIPASSTRAPSTSATDQFSAAQTPSPSTVP